MPFSDKTLNKLLLKNVGKTLSVKQTVSEQMEGLDVERQKLGMLCVDPGDTVWDLEPGIVPRNRNGAVTGIIEATNYGLGQASSARGSSS